MTEKRWFIRDEIIQSVGQDAFSHIHFARELKAKIEELGPPLTVALSGLHGTGKSSIGFLLQEQFRNDDKYVFVRIEAWRHEGESRRKAFLYDVLEELEKRFHGTPRSCDKLKVLRSQLYASRAVQTAELDLAAAKNSLNTLWQQVNSRSIRAGIVLGLITAALIVAWYFATVNVAPKIAASALLSNAPSVLSLPLTVALIGYFGSVLKQISDKVLEPAKITVTNNPPASAEQYEHVFREALQIAGNDSNEQKVVIIFVDELDRLAPNEIIEAIKAIRTFRDVKPCVFVVALDEEVVRLAIREARNGLGLMKSSEEAEEFLNKFFKHRQHVPLLVPSDMRDFARTLIATPRDAKEAALRCLTAGIAELLEDLLGEVIDVLIHRGVKTPRHAIRLLNAFNGDYRLAQVREAGDEPLLSKGALTDRLPFLAVMTVLREDFHDFYVELSRNRELIQALDLLLDERPEKEVEEQFPGYIPLCRPFFAQKQTAGIEDTDSSTDFSTPHSDHRNLLLYLRDTAKYRVPNLFPFLYLRESPSARTLGSELHQNMAEEFESNLVSSLRRRVRDGGDPYAFEAAKIALYCLDEARDHRLENTILATCELFDNLAPAYQQQLGERIAQRLAQNRSFIARCKPDLMLGALSHAQDSPYRRTCVTSLLSQLAPDAWERSYAIFEAAIQHPALITTQEQENLLSTFMAGATGIIPATDVQILMKRLAESKENERVIHHFFGPGFIEGVAAVTADLKKEEYPVGYTNDLVAAFEAMESGAVKEWKERFLNAATRLINARLWAPHDLGLSILRRHQDDLSNAGIHQALATLYNNNNWPGDDAGLGRYEVLYSFTLFLAGKEKEAFNDADLQSSLNDYFADRVASQSEEVRQATRDSLLALALAFRKDFFDDAATTLAAYVPTNAPSPPALSALKVTVALSGRLPVESWLEMLNTLTTSLRLPATDAQAAFGADALILVVTSDVEDAVRAEALKFVTPLIGFISASYAPERLVQVARVLDGITEHLGPSLLTYLDNLSAYIGTSSPNFISFVLQRLKVLEGKQLVANTHKAKLARDIIERWTYIPDILHKEVASDLLATWAEHIPEAVRESHWAFQAELLPQSPSTAWKSLRPAWVNLPQSLHIQTLLTAAGDPAIGTLIFPDIAARERSLGSKKVAELLADLEAQLDSPSFVTVASALTDPLDEEDRNKVSSALFAHLNAQTDRQASPALMSQAIMLASRISDEGILYFSNLLRGDEQYRVFALDSMTPYFDGKNTVSSPPGEIVQAMASAVATDPNHLLKKNLEAAKVIGLLHQQGYLSALEERAALLKESDDNANKELHKEIRGILRKTSRR